MGILATVSQRRGAPETMEAGGQATHCSRISRVRGAIRYPRRAIRHREKGRVIILGRGEPAILYFTTDHLGADFGATEIAA